jgi:5,10-methylenetetrahydrofolate reductase
MIYRAIRELSERERPFDAVTWASGSNRRASWNWSATAPT